MEFRSPVCIFLPVILVVLCVDTLPSLVNGQQPRNKQTNNDALINNNGTTLFPI